jgi:dTDP-4-amino-4,6-dideoxygalactose transaminase
VSAWYEEALADLDGVGRPTAAPWARPAWFVQAVRVAEDVDRDRFLEVLARHGIEAKAYFAPPIHRQPPYAGDDSLLAAPLPNTEEASERTIIVPFWAAMTQGHVARVADALRRGIAEVRR